MGIDIDVCFVKCPFLSIVMVSYRMLLQLERANEVPLFTAFILFFYQ